LWNAPNYESERLSQLFWGEPVEELERHREFSLIKQPDGYQGWVDNRFLAQITPEAYHRCPGDCNAAVISSVAPLFNEPGTGTRPPHFIFFGTKIRIDSTDSAFTAAQIPNGGQACLRTSDIRVFGDDPARCFDPELLLNKAREFLGVPYLWGGISSAGFDCSGFVRTLFQSLGIYLPRDTKDQIGVGRKIEPLQIRPADLLFFRRHVAIAIDTSRFIHSSRGGGGVRINSFIPGEPDFRQDLKDSFDHARRVV
jgi:hypothetical protein